MWEKEESRRQRVQENGQEQPMTPKKHGSKETDCGGTVPKTPESQEEEHWGPFRWEQPNTPTSEQGELLLTAADDVPFPQDA